MEVLSFSQELRARFERHMAGFSRQVIDDPALRQAAVCIAVVETEGEACFLLTRRPGRMSRHSGQYALPGGRLDDGEGIETAALRELEEELGVSASTVDVIGRLDDFATRSGFRITPVVVWLEGTVELRPDPGEVDAAFRVPVQDLTRPGIPILKNIPESDRPVLSMIVHSLSDEVFAPTAAMLYQFREVALYGRDTRVAHYEQPVFAWK